mmetsp:Transcript_48091/g.140144  ORF Transcript_48091/g.140144 Transcript_48091/m.140144 type:complete len:268 (-) Transcript_48091:506-1309(-)
MGLGVLRVAGGLTQGAECLELLPTLVGFLEPLVGGVALVNDRLDALPTRRAGPTARVHADDLHVDDHAALGAIVFHGIGLQIHVAAAPGPTPHGDQFDGLLLALAHADLHRRRVLVLDRHEAIAGQDGDALAAAGDAEAALGHPTARAPMHGDIVEVLSALFAAGVLDVHEHTEVLLQVLDFSDAQQLDNPCRRRLRGVEALGIEVHGLSRHGEERALADVHLLRRGRPNWGGARVAQGEDHGALALLGVRLLVVDRLEFEEGQMPF